jgi:hypothetical protein
MAKPLGLLVASFNFAGAAEDEFQDWYDHEHVPERARVPGFLTLQRWIGAEDPKISVATYDLQTADVLQSPQYRAIAGENLSPWSVRVIGKCRRLLRFEGEQILSGSRVSPQNAGGLLMFAMNVEPDAESDFNDWYDNEHVPNLAAVPGVLCARRFRATQSTHKYLALYHLESPEVTTSAGWKKAALTPWTERVRPHTRDRLRIVCRSYRRASI